MVTAFHLQSAADIAAMPIHMKIRSLILIRLGQAAPYKEVVRRTLAVLARPQHTKLASQLLYSTVDEMWRAAGDTSTDYNFYTKRATLSAVYSATLLAFLSDNSADMAKTEAFLDRRLADVARLPKIARPAKAMADMAMRFAGLAAGRFAGPDYAWPSRALDLNAIFADLITLDFPIPFRFIDDLIPLCLGPDRLKRVLLCR